MSGRGASGGRRAGARAPREGREADLRLKGPGLRAQFVLSMSAALVVILSLSAALIYVSAERIAEHAWTRAIARGVKLSQQNPRSTWRFSKLQPSRDWTLTSEGVYLTAYRHPEHEGVIYSYPLGPEDDETSLVTGEELLDLVVPEVEGGRGNLLGLLFAVTSVVILVGAGMAYWAARRVSRPVNRIIEDVRQIAKGDLKHKTRSGGAGEIELLARAINRMTRDLEVAREAEWELSVRQREREVAGGVREALLPLATPLVEGYDMGAAWLASDEFGGDFHDFIERPDGRLGLLICDVSGSGIPAALIGATARSYLRSELERGDDLAASFRRVNRWMVADMRRGTFVSALYVLLDPARGVASVVCAGHKVPLLRFDAAGKQLRVVHPEGIALGFDRGPVFDRKLQVVDTPIEPGDRFLLANSAPLGLPDEGGRELGEKAFYSRVLRHAELETTSFLKALRRDLERYVGEAGIHRDVSLLTVQREA